MSEDYSLSWPELGSPPATERRIVWGTHEGELLDAVEVEIAFSDETTQRSYNVMRCELCGFIHVAPLPEREHLSRYYAHQFYQKSKPDYVARYEADRDWWEMTHRHLLTFVGTVLARRNHGTQPQVLDVGTGPGIFLDVARAAGWRTWGVEPSGHLAADVRKRGHKVFAGTLEEVMSDLPGMRGQRYDLIHAYEVLEHLPNPYDFLTRLHGLLHAQGLLALVVPNDYNPLQLQICHQLQRPPWWLAPPEHLNYFTPRALSELLARCGFTTIELRGTYPMERFIIAGHNYLGNDEVGRECHVERMRGELTADAAGQWPLVEANYRANMWHGRQGREIVLLACKKGADYEQRGPTERNA